MPAKRVSLARASYWVDVERCAYNVVVFAAFYKKAAVAAVLPRDCETSRNEGDEASHWQRSARGRTDVDHNNPRQPTVDVRTKPRKVSPTHTLTTSDSRIETTSDKVDVSDTHGR